jgi:hypothetical protein
VDEALGKLYEEFDQVHYPHLSRYVVSIAHEDEDPGTDKIGSGVSVAFGGRHFIATAGHCIKRNPRVMRGNDFFTTSDRIVTIPPVRIIGKWSHASLDIGMLEVAEVLDLEMIDTQLCFDRISEGYVLHIIGFPESRRTIDHRRREIDLVKTAFAATVLEQADDYLKLDYPTHGRRFDGEQWLTEPFIATPRGFSGGGCFGVTNSGDVQVVGYKLIGIQCSWSERQRYVKAVPIRHWLDGVKAYLGVA